MTPVTAVAFVLLVAGAIAWLALVVTWIRALRLGGKAVVDVNSKGEGEFELAVFIALMLASLVVAALLYVS